MEFAIWVNVVVSVVGFMGLAYVLYRILDKPIPVGKTTYLGSLGKFSEQDDVTTTIPIPIHAATCDHDWEVVTDNVLEMDHEKKVVTILACSRCGMVDKTVQKTSPMPPIMPKPPEPCKHDWVLQKDVLLEMPHEKKAVVIMTCAKCGEVNKTQETTSKIPSELASPKSECRHDWIVDKRVTLDSAYEQMAKALGTKSGYYSKKTVDSNKLGIDYNNAPAWMFRKTYLIHRTCSKCGEVYTILASNFDEAGQKEEIEGEVNNL